MQDQTSTALQDADTTVHAPQSSAGMIDSSNELSASPTGPADNGLGEHVGWDFQDIPLDNPQAAQKRISTSQQGTAQALKTSAGHKFSDKQPVKATEDQEIVRLQQENQMLKQRLKHVEAVSHLTLHLCAKSHGNTDRCNCSAC